MVVFCSVFSLPGIPGSFSYLNCLYFFLSVYSFLLGMKWHFGVHFLFSVDWFCLFVLCVLFVLLLSLAVTPFIFIASIVLFLVFLELHGPWAVNLLLFLLFGLSLYRLLYLFYVRIICSIYRRSKYDVLCLQC